VWLTFLDFNMAQVQNAP